MAEPDRDHETLGQRLREFEAAAIEAEFETGRRETTVREAERHLLVRIGRVLLGIVVLVAGLLMLPLPGPGMLTIAAGLALLASDVPFARRWLDRVRERVPSDADGRISKPVLIGGLVFSAVTVSFSAWWTFLR